jgi:uncharacterized Fe-S cluster protein YjdI/CDGSH-type Zn-finger protein
VVNDHPTSEQGVGMAVKDYQGDGIVVHWDAERCQHSGRCVAGAPTVFDTGARPWIVAGNLPADELAAVIDTCPSGALSYTRTDGRPHGRRGHDVDADPTAARRADDVATVAHGDSPTPSVTPRANGPLVVEGPVTLVGPDGSTEVVDRLVLCRCGGSGAKPRCDGTHKRIGFEAAGMSPPAHPSP